MNSYSNVLLRFVVALALAIAIPTSGVGAAEPRPLTKKDVKTLIKTAQTPAEHMKIAEYFRLEAKRLKENAKEHDEMAAEYFRDPSRYPAPKYPTMGQHCRQLSAAYSAAADKAMTLALEHEAMAKETAR